MPEAYIVAAVRTAGGRRGGRLRDWHPIDLGAAVLDAVVARSGVEASRIDDVIFGCVTPIGEQAYNIARNAVLASGLPESIGGITIDRACGSSQQALHFAAQAVMSGSSDAIIAGGVESMTRAPMMSSGTLAQEKGLGVPHSPGMERRRPGFMPNQFRGAEMLGAKYGLTRAMCDEFAFHSHRKAAAAANSGSFANEILPLEYVNSEGLTELHSVDEGIRFETSIDSIGGVKLLMEGGMISAATSSQICDGASAVMVVSEALLKEYDLKPIARIHQMTTLGHDPEIMVEAPIPATELALKKAGLSIADIDLYEVNEAFATVPLAWAKATGADPARLNVHGGAIALGHPLGSSGTKLATTLINALRANGKRYGLQTMCEAGGLANVTIFEAL